jgi:N-formylglutamate amidohydrolase
MIVIAGSGKYPVIYTVEHASANLHRFAERCALSPNDVRRFSDYDTELTVPSTNATATVISGHSRALGDANRPPNNEELFPLQDFGKPRNNVWLPGRELTKSEQRALRKKYYDPYHNAIISQLKKAPPELAINDDGKPVMMPSIILSNRGLPDTAEIGDELVTCNPELLRSLGFELSKQLGLAGLASDVCLNYVFKGGYATQRYSSLRNSGELKSLGIGNFVQSLQVEYNTRLTNDQKSLEPNLMAMRALSSAFEKALAITLEVVGLDVR